MRISVVVLVYNLDAYIGQAVDSVLGQTRTADEVIVVDDCSTDRSAERVKAYGDKVRYLRLPENSGALLAALHGVKAAKGDVLCMLDGDDFWAANKLQVVERKFKDDPDLMLLSHGHVRVDERGFELPIRDETHRNIAAVRQRARSGDDLSAQLKSSILEQRGFWLGSAYSFRKRLFDIPTFDHQIAGFGSERLKDTYLDLVIAPFLVLTNPSKTVGYASGTRLFYRVHGKGSLAGNSSPEMARRSAQKGRTVNELIDLILRQNQAPADIVRRRGLLLQHYDFLLALYDGKIARAARIHARLATSLWSRDQLWKETKRLIAVALLGPARFLELKDASARDGAREVNPG